MIVTTVLATLRYPCFLSVSPGSSDQCEFVTWKDDGVHHDGVDGLAAFLGGHPPFDLDPHEFPAPGELPDIPAIVADRKAKKLKKAADRREARRKKLERQRA